MYQTWLIPYLEGTLDAEQRHQLEVRLADDPALAAELDSLRRTEPRLRQSIAYLKGVEATVSPTSLWPRLRDRLDARPARPRYRPYFWWGGGLCAASALVLAVILGPLLYTPHPARIADSSGQKPVVLRQDNAVGTRMAQKLRAQAVRVAAQRQAAHPPLAMVPVPSARVAAASPVKPMPQANKIARPTAPPVQVASRAPSETSSPLELPPAPTRSPPSSPMNRLAQQPKEKTAQAAGGFGGGGAAPEPTATPPQVNAPLSVAGGASGMAVLAPPNGQTNGAAAPAQKLRVFAKMAPHLRESTGNSSINGNAPEGLATPTLLQRLERTLTPPLYGTAEGEAEEERLLTDAQRGGSLSALRMMPVQHSRPSSAPSEAEEAASARLRAALDEADGDWERAAAERRRIAHRPNAVAEDWYVLARTEALLGNAADARRAYVKALGATPPLSAGHRDLARQNAL